MIILVFGSCANLLGVFFSDLISWALLRFLTGVGANTVCSLVFVTGKRLHWGACHTSKAATVTTELLIAECDELHSARKGRDKRRKPAQSYDEI